MPKVLGKFLDQYIGFRWTRRNKRKCKNTLLILDWRLNEEKFKEH